MTLSSRAAFLAGALVLVVAVPAAAGPVPAPVSPRVTEMPLAGGIAALLRAAGVPGGQDPSTAMVAFVRAVYSGRTRPPEQLLRYLDGVARQPAATTDVVPLPLSPGTWASSILRRRVPPEQLALAIFGNVQASLVYHGLMAMDDETLGYFESHEAVLSAVVERSPGAFASWGRSIRIRGGRVALPGGQDAAPLWEAVVGARVSETDRFVRELLSRDAGRAAFFYDTVAHLDTAHRAFALGQALADDRVGRFKALYGSFARTASVEAGGLWPVVRHPVSPAATLARVLVGDGGRMAPPAARPFWDAVFDGNPRACSAARAADAGGVDAAWLAERIDAEPAARRGEALAAVTFAQRVFARVNGAGLQAACEVVSSFPHHQALLLTLERMGLDDPADYAAAVAFAAKQWSGLDRRAAVMRTAQAEGVLAIVDRAVGARTIDRATARRLVASLVAVPESPGAAPAWIVTHLLPAVCPQGLSTDACLVRAVSGEGSAGHATGTVRWEDQDYRVDLGAATAERVRRIRQLQRATLIGDALDVASAAGRLLDARAGAAEWQRQGAVLKSIAPGPNLEATELFGHGVPRVRELLQAAAVRLASNSGEAERADLAVSLQHAADVMLADALVSFAYALAIGDPDESVLMEGDPSRKHRFDSTLGPATEPWHLPEEVQALDRSWLVEGSILGLHTVFARSWLRRLSIQDPGMRPRPEPQDVRAFGESEAVFNAFDLTNEDRDAIVAAIKRGRTRWQEAVGQPEAAWRTAAEAGIAEWRCRAALWAGRTKEGTGGDYVSLSEFLRLGSQLPTTSGTLDAWGVSTRHAGGPLAARMPSQAWEDVEGPRGVGLLPSFFADVHLHAAEMLADLHLPAALAPGITGYASWDVLTSAEMAHPDDWLALIRAARSLPEDRTFDYVAALTAIGPLVPVR